MSTRPLILVSVWMLIACTASGSSPNRSEMSPPVSTGRPTGHASARTRLRQPNIVLILTDDQRFDALSRMPVVQHRLADEGVTFTDAYAVNPLCCPSRASILTGGYSHTTGIYTNVPPHGGFADFRDRSTIATWLHRAGYLNALVGKYLNGYTHITYIPPGWDHWFTLQSGEYYDYVLTHQGVLRSFGHAPRDYSTHVLADHAVQFLRQVRSPFFLYLAPDAPHYPAVPGPGDGWAFPNLPAWRPPSYNERNVADKPSWVRRLPRLTAQDRASIDRFRLRQYRSLLAVDTAVGRILNVLSATGRLRNTLIVFTSDQGIEWGEHRWTSKQDPYEATIRIPLIVRYDRLLAPAIRGPRTDGHLVLNIDLAPTFAAAAGVSAPGADGRSLLPLLRGADISWRRDFLIEHMESDRPVPTYCAVHTDRYVYIVYATGEQELYDLSRDPYELVNRASAAAYGSIRASLRSKLARLCRPAPPGFHVDLSSPVAGSPVSSSPPAGTP